MARVHTGSTNEASRTTFGFVCDDAFNYYAARAACKQLGLAPRNGSIEFRSVRIDVADFALDDVSCRFDSSDLNDCTARTSGHNCGVSEGVRLLCAVNPQD